MRFFIFCFLIATLSACQKDSERALLPEVSTQQRTEVSTTGLLNEEATIPPQCYTETNGIHNPCYVCHQNYDRKISRINQLDDGGLQGTYLFSDIGVKNHWENLFVNREVWIESISDENILAYVNQDNYHALPDKLKSANWQGFIPDLKNYASAKAAFDEHGLAIDGSNWVAFNYKPLPSTFWPTNGSTDDVLIRLPKAFREINGVFSESVYFLNLSILEMTIKDLASITIIPIDEHEIKTDVDNNGKLNIASEIKLNPKFYLGDASTIPVTFQQFPLGTEFMHSVRYVGIDTNGDISVSPRMKELRYMRKNTLLSESQISGNYTRERKEKLEGELPVFVNYADDGLSNGYGWILQAFIEDYDGSLRPQNHEEMNFCMGCHSAIGSTLDHTFSFGRKVTGERGWSYINLKGMYDAPSISSDKNEILEYFERAGGGNEFRANEEIIEKWFKHDGTPDTEKVMAADVYSLITPSYERALKLNKAYSHIVRRQSFIYGRDATWLPPVNVKREVDENIQPLKYEHRYLGWDIRLNWKNAAK